MAAVLELARCVAVALSPVTPRLAGAILLQLGCSGVDEAEEKGVLWNSSMSWVSPGGLWFHGDLRTLSALSRMLDMLDFAGASGGNGCHVGGG